MLPGTAAELSKICINYNITHKLLKPALKPLWPMTNSTAMLNLFKAAASRDVPSGRRALPQDEQHWLTQAYPEPWNQEHLQVVWFGSAAKPMPWRVFGWHPHTSCHLLVTSGERQNWEEVELKAHLNYSLPSGAPFPPLFGSLICWGGHNCPCPSLLCMCMYMTWLGRVPGNFIVFPGKTWLRKGRFTCHHTSWKSSRLCSLLLLVSCVLWSHHFKWTDVHIQSSCHWWILSGEEGHEFAVFTKTLTYCGRRR